MGDPGSNRRGSSMFLLQPATLEKLQVICYPATELNPQGVFIILKPMEFSSQSQAARFQLLVTGPWHVSLHL